MTDTQIDRPSHWLQWAEEIFGPIALDPSERALRFAEEALEAVQAIGLSRDAVLKVVERAYSRPAGAVPRELGQCLATFECLARVVGVDADAECSAELARVKAIPKEEWARRHSAKVALGTALPA